MMMRLPAIVLVGCVLLLALSADALPKRFHQSGMHRPVVRRGMAAASDPQEQYYNTQTIDHFSADGKGVFKQRFFVNDTYWGGAGYPVFLILGGEGPISVSDVTNHFIIPQYAAAYNALVISLEHRFYGLTQPFPDTSVDNLLYLTSNQALADIAQFTTWFTQEYKTGDAPWITWGGSYSGALAAWYRLKYPQLTAGAIASSAPVEAILEFSEYLVTVGSDLDRACYNIVANATQQIETLLSTNPSQLETLFETCTPIKQSDWNYFMEAITDPLAGIAQYSNDNVDYQPFNVSTMCSMLKNISSDPVTAYAGVVKAINQFNGARCTDISYDAYIDFLSITALNDTAARSWTWQTCTEFGYFQTGSASNQPFSSLINLQLFENICSDAFSPQYTVPNTNWTNTYYGGAKNSGTLIAFPNGEVDPWHNLGVLQPNNRFESSLIMSDTAHCADLYPASSHDPHDLRVTRQQEQELVSMWINNFHSKPTL